ncbi:hypothetical protein OKW29_000153 [Paraburkholderia sp. CI3]
MLDDCAHGILMFLGFVQKIHLARRLGVGGSHPSHQSPTKYAKELDDKGVMMRVGALGALPSVGDRFSHASISLGTSVMSCGSEDRDIVHGIGIYDKDTKRVWFPLLQTGRVTKAM